MWREVKKYPIKEQYALCRCGKSQNKPFCDGSHVEIEKTDILENQKRKSERKTE
ncbi:CDGSH iron-sulfur domain-containing protein [Methanosarcina sp. UBA5]|uniref:CDGSH iron-sulfur domain-containing protein n=1 Tax=Methanosarcina sp. UBA5 TaxID=1915593 RepID=UPI0025DBE037|nr:CDGSH iron-sulfur domain-containing protein [Methanosarcina sp. UBA5]